MKSRWKVVFSTANMGQTLMCCRLARLPEDNASLLQESPGTFSSTFSSPGCTPAAWAACRRTQASALLYNYLRGCSELTAAAISSTWMWFWGHELGQQREHNLCLSPGLWVQQLLLLGRFAYGLGTVLNESTVLHGWGQKICLLWTCSHSCNIKPAFGVQAKIWLKK